MMICELAAGDLVAYLDGELGGARLEYVEAHLRCCAECRERLARLRETVEIMQSATPTHDDPENRSQTMALIVEEARRTQQRSRRALMIVAVSAAVLLLGILLWPSTPANAGFYLSSLVQRVVPRTAHHSDPSTVLSPDRLPGVSTSSESGHPKGVAPSFAVAVPPRLPGDLTLISFAQVRTDLATLRYASPNQLVIQLNEEPENAPETTISSPHQLVVIDGTEVVWNVDPYSGSILRAIWARHGVQFDLSVSSSMGDGLTSGVARQIIQQVIVAQNGGGA